MAVPAHSLSLATSAHARAASAYVATLANEIAAQSCGAFIETRAREAVADLASALAIPTLAGIPHARVARPISYAKADAATALHAFAACPSVSTWLDVDRTLATLTASLARVAESRPARLLSMTAPACEPAGFIAKRAHSDDVNQLHAGSAGVARTKPSACPLNFSEAAELHEARAIRAEKRLKKLLATNRKARAAVLLIGSM